MYYQISLSYWLAMYWLWVKKVSIKRILKWVFGGISIVFVVMLFIIVVHDALTGTIPT